MRLAISEKVEIFLKAIGKVYKEQREKRGITREQIAKRVNMTLEEIIDLENGIVKNFTEDDLEFFLESVKSNYAKNASVSLTKS